MTSEQDHRPEQRWVALQPEEVWGQRLDAIGDHQVAHRVSQCLQRLERCLVEGIAQIADRGTDTAITQSSSELLRQRSQVALVIQHDRPLLCHQGLRDRLAIADDNLTEW